MNLNYEAIFDFYMFKGRKYLCHIKVNPKSQKFKNTCRSLTQEQWTTFDKKLEKALTANDQLGEKGIKFKLSSSIVVKVQKSKLRIKHFSKLLQNIDESDGKYTLDSKEQGSVLECLIEFQQKTSSSTSADTRKNNLQVNMSPDAKKSSPLLYEPYVPSMKIFTEQDIDIIKNNDIDTNEDTYSPKPLVDINMNDAHFPPAIPQYIPAPINDSRKSKDIKNLNFLKEAENKVNTIVKQKAVKINSNKKYKRIECEYIPESQDISTLNVPVYIPTPIEVARDNTRVKRKRSNTIDVLTNLVDENNDQRQSLKAKQQSYEEIVRYQPSNKSLKRRSMTIDEIPAELSDMPVYIPTPLQQCAFQSVSKGCGSRKTDVTTSLKDVSIGENVKENQFCPERVGYRLPKDTGRSQINNLNQKTILSTIDQFGLDSAQEILALGKLNVLEEPDGSKQFSTGAAEGLQFKHYDDNIITKSLSAESNAVDKNKIKGKREAPEKDQAHFEDLSFHNSLEGRSRESLKVNDIRKNDNKAFQNFRRSERATNISKSSKAERNSGNRISGKHKSSLKNKDLFGTDDEDDEDFHFKNNKIEMISKSCEISARKCANISLSTKNRLKKDKSDEIYEKN